MAFKRKVWSKGHEYWILVHPIRMGGRIIQKTKYLGKVLPGKEQLRGIEKRFIEEINRNKYKYLSSKDVENVEAKKILHKQELRRLRPVERDEKMREFMIRYTYDSSKLSGMDITLRQTFLILKKGIIPEGFRNLRTAKELENHRNGIVAITKYKRPLNIQFIKKLHIILFAGIDDTLAGKLRSELKRDVKIAGTPYVPPKWHAVEKELRQFFKWYKSESRKLHPLELAALVHLRIISLQPFADGNSRLARLLMNWILWKKNYPLIDIPIEDLEKYYNALDKYQIEHDESQFIEYIKRKYLENNE